MKRGVISHKDVDLTLEPGSIIFKGDPEAPALNLEARTEIADTRINIRLRGTPDKPEFTLSSDPHYPEEKLLVMFAYW